MQVIRGFLATFFIFSVLIFAIGITIEALKPPIKRSIHDNEIHLFLNKYSNILDIERTKINFQGSGYYFFHSSRPGINISLYLKSYFKECEILLSIRNELIDFFNNNRWEKREKHAFPEWVVVNFFLRKDEEAELFYWFEFDSYEQLWIDQNNKLMH